MKSLVVYFRNRLTSFDAMFALLIFVLLFLIIYTFDDYGLTSDEPIRHKYGEAVFNFYASIFSDKSAQNMGVHSFYGGLFDVSVVCVLNIANSLRFEPDIYDLRHFINALYGVLGITGAFFLARFLSGSRAGFISALILTLIPAYYGAMFINPKDIPYASMYVWSLYFGLRVICRLPKQSWRQTIIFGFSLGLLLAIKVVGAMVVLFLFAGLIIKTIQSWTLWRNTYRTSDIVKNLLVKVILPSAIISYLLMLAFWPWAWIEPLTRPVNTIFNFTDFVHWKGTVYLWGQEYDYNNIPWLYLPSYFLVLLPEFVLILLVSCIFLAIKNAAIIKNKYSAAFTSLTLALMFPFIYAIINESVIYTGMRHFTFTLPLIAVACGISFDKLIQFTREKSTRTFHILLITSAFVVLTQVRAMWKLHPLEYIYFNQLIGGYAGAAYLMETDYWHSSYRETVNLLVEYIKNKEYPDQKEIGVAVGHGKFIAEYYYPDWMHSRSVSRADYYIGDSRYDSWSKHPDKPIIVRVMRDGAPVAIVRELR